MEPMVIVHIRADGAFDILASGEVRVIWVDENGAAQNDRIFEQTDRVSPSEILRVLGPEAVGATLAPKPAPRPNLRLVEATAESVKP